MLVNLETFEFRFGNDLCTCGRKMDNIRPFSIISGMLTNDKLDLRV